MVTVNLDQARRMKAIGALQGMSHHRWYWWAPGVFEHLPEPELSCPGMYGEKVWYQGSTGETLWEGSECCDAPDLLTALNWLEQQGWSWGREPADPEEKEAKSVWWANEVDGVGWGEADNPSNLLDAVLAKLERI